MPDETLLGHCPYCEKQILACHWEIEISSGLIPAQEAGADCPHCGKPVVVDVAMQNIFTIYPEQNP